MRHSRRRVAGWGAHALSNLGILRLLEEELYGGGQQLQLHLGRLLFERLEEMLQLLIRVVDTLRVFSDDPDYARLPHSPVITTLELARTSRILYYSPLWFPNTHDSIYTSTKYKYMLQIVKSNPGVQIPGYRGHAHTPVACIPETARE